MPKDSLDTYELKGEIKIVTRDSATKKIIEKRERSNTIVRGIRPIIVNMLANSGFTGTLPKLDMIKFGDSNTPASVNDTALSGTVLVTKPILQAAAMSDSDRKATFSVLLNDDEANGMNIREAGLFSGNTLVARTTFGTYTKASGTYFEFYWTIGYDA